MSSIQQYKDLLKRKEHLIREMKKLDNLNKEITELQHKQIEKDEQIILAQDQIIENYKAITKMLDIRIETLKHPAWWQFWKK